jgi:hypothetical protein
MSLRWLKRRSPLACTSGGERYACASRPMSDPCFDGCPEKHVRPAVFETSQDGYPRPTYLGKRGQKTEGAVTSTSSGRIATRSVVTTITPSALSNEPSPSSSTAPTTTPPNRPNVAVIVGVSVGSFVLLLLIGIIVFFWIHTQRSRHHHNRTFERRLSDPGDGAEMSQKQLLRVAITAESRSPQISCHFMSDPLYSSTNTNTTSTQSFPCLHLTHHHDGAQSFPTCVPQYRCRSIHVPALLS